MIDLVLLIARLLFVALLYLFLFAIMRHRHRHGQRFPQEGTRLDGVGGTRPQRAARRLHRRARPVIVGRSPGADIVIGARLRVRRHARFQLMGQNLFVEDLGSKNGTAVNGRPVHDPVALRNKDLVTIGDVDIRVRNQ